MAVSIVSWKAARSPRLAPPLPSGAHHLVIGVPSLAFRDRRAQVHFALSRGDAVSRSSLLVAGHPEDRVLHDLALLKRLLEAGGRLLESDDRVGLLRAMCGIRAYMRVRALDGGYVVIDEVLEP